MHQISSNCTRFKVEPRSAIHCTCQTSLIAEPNQNFMNRDDPLLKTCAKRSAISLAAANCGPLQPRARGFQPGGMIVYNRNSNTSNVPPAGKLQVARKTCGCSVGLTMASPDQTCLSVLCGCHRCG